MQRKLKDFEENRSSHNSIWKEGEALGPEVVECEVIGHLHCKV